MTDPTIRHIGILFFPDVEELDAIGPWEVFSFWATHIATADTKVTALGLTDEPVRCANGLRVVVDAALTEQTELDLLVHPGGQGTDSLETAASQLDLLRHHHRNGTVMTSVCTGSLVFAAAGLLRGQPATTHWGVLPRLRELDPTITPIDDERWVDTGQVVTSAGVSAGIDMALYLVSRLDGPDAAATVARGLQYDHWDPASAMA